MRGRRRAALWAALAPMLLLAFVRAEAKDVRLSRKDGRVYVEAASYTAAVDERGFVSEIAVGGEAFVSPVEPGAAGVYFYQGRNMCPPGKPSIGRNGTVAAAGGRAAVRYVFRGSAITIKARNCTERPMFLFIVLSSDVAAVKDPDKGFLPAPVKKSTTDKATFYRGTHKLTVKGMTNMWGPWRGDHQVVQVDLGPDKEETVILEAGKATEAEIKKVRSLNAGLEVRPAPFELLSPLDYQVFQRTGRDEGYVLVSGRMEGASAASVRIRGRTRAKKTFDSGELSVPVTGGAFRERLAVPAGGWYEVTVRGEAGGKKFEAKVEHVGVGEVFVGAGQSNSTNCGEERQKVKSGMVSTFDGGKWRIADDPQPGCHDKSANGSFWPPFGDALYRREKVPVGVAVTGHGGTSVRAWQPGGELYEWMMRRIYRLGPGGFRAVLWHQGESDVGMSSRRYASMLANVILSSKRDAGWEFPWFVARVSYHSPKAPSFAGTREAQKKLWDLGIALPGPDTDTLTGDNRARGGKGIHFSGKGLRAHGEMWAKIVGDYLDRILGE